MKRYLLHTLGSVALPVILGFGIGIPLAIYIGSWIEAMVMKAVTH